jgi:predicted phosphodiesterase
MKIQYISDIHLEHYGENFLKLPVVAEYLALVGDIGYPSRNNYKEFIKWCSENYMKVFLILGNHEYYYEENMDNSKAIVLEIISNYDNIYLLDNDKIEVEDYTILGTTLWSCVPEEASSVVEKYVNDYHNINIYGMPINNIDITNNFFNKNVKWLEKELNEAQENNRKFIILTHHAPLIEKTSDPKYEIHDRQLNYAFSSDLSYLMKEPIKAWIFGHTHWTCDFLYNNIRIISNGIGYKNERDYVLDKFIELN